MMRKRERKKHKIYAWMTCTKIHYERVFPSFTLRAQSRSRRRISFLSALKMGVWRARENGISCFPPLSMCPFTKRADCSGLKRKFLFKDAEKNIFSGFKFPWMVGRGERRSFFRARAESILWIIMNLHLKSQILVKEWEKLHKNRKTLYGELIHDGVQWGNGDNNDLRNFSLMNEEQQVELFGSGDSNENICRAASCGLSLIYRSKSTRESSSLPRTSFPSTQGVKCL